MDPASGADRPAPPESPGLTTAAGGFTAAAARFLRALTGLFGLELRETGWHALAMAALAVGLIASAVIAYLFLLAGVIFFVVARLDGGGWLWVLLTVGALHLLAAAALLYVLMRVARHPLFPGTREALRREMERLS